MKKNIFRPLLYIIAGLIFICDFSAFAQNEKTALTKEDKEKFISQSSKMLNERYVFPEVAKKIEEHLKEKSVLEKIKDITEPKEFADIMTKEMQSISHDKHLRVFLRPAPVIKNEKEDPMLESILRQRRQKESNFAFTKVEILPGNIGYIDFRAFVDLASGREAASAAMKFLSNSYAIIFDLRKNGGGNPEMIQYICSYFFDKPTHLNSLYYREGDRTIEYWTHDKIDGKKMVDVPLFVLTSNYTFSGAEEFSYNMQTRKRATLIGEITGGGANPGGTMPVDKTFSIFIPGGRAINPVTGTNWEGVGVKPEIIMTADKAYDIALEKAKEAADKYSAGEKEKIILKYKNFKEEIDKAEILYKDKKETEAEKRLLEGLNAGMQNGFLNESGINNIGYNYLNAKNFQMAIAVFKFNVSTFPKSGNVYDSLGEAYMSSGNKKLAIINYKKSVELDPKNNNGMEALKKLQVK